MLLIALFLHKNKFVKILLKIFLFHFLLKSSFSYSPKFYFLLFNIDLALILGKLNSATVYVSLRFFFKLVKYSSNIFFCELIRNWDISKLDPYLEKFGIGKYTGIDVLKNIREQDAEIYIIYLTNKDFVEDHIGEFDQTVKKKELAKEIDNVVRRLTRALSRDLSLKNEREIENNYKLQKEYLDERIEALKEYLRK